MDEVEYREFRVGDILNIESSNGIYHACNVVIEEHKSLNNHPYVVRTSRNNGLRGYIEEDETTLNPGNTISFAQDTAHMFYQNEPYFTGNKIKVMTLKSHEMTEHIAIFLIACLSRAFCIFDWGVSYDTDILRNVIVSLPITPDGTPDWEYMQRYIEELEQRYIEELEQYLIASGLDDYHLSDEEKELSLCERETAEFRVGDLFDIHPTKAYKLTNDKLFEIVGETPVVSNTSGNNGIGGHSNLSATEKGEIITFSDTTTGGDTVFYQPVNFIGYPHIQGMYPKFEGLSETTALYLISAIKCAAGDYWDYSVKFRRDLVSELRLVLPIDSNSDPDWQYMHDYIRTVEKLVIKDVVDYKNGFLKNTGRIVNKV